MTITALVSGTVIYRKDANGARYFHGDALGSMRSMTDSSQAITATYRYDGWGKLLEQTGETANEYKFTGRRFEDDIGLQYNRARFYDPEIGRFITQDPLTGGPDDPTISYSSDIYSILHRVIKDYIDSRNPDQLNRYGYCDNNALNFSDPLGLYKYADERNKDYQWASDRNKSYGWASDRNDSYGWASDRNESYKWGYERNQEYKWADDRNREYLLSLEGKTEWYKGDLYQHNIIYRDVDEKYETRIDSH